MSIKHELPPAETDWAFGTAVKHLLRLATASDEYHEALKDATERHHHENPGEMVAYRTLSGNQSLDDLYEVWLAETKKSMAFLDKLEATLAKFRVTPESESVGKPE